MKGLAIPDLCGGSTQSYVCETEALESQNLLSQEDMDRRGAGCWPWRY